MFSTFTATPSKENHQTPPPSQRAKRHQVARTCDWCRVHRVKCDNNSPCQNCRDRGGRCTKKSVSKGVARTQMLPEAVREIERLQQKVRDLEDRLKNATHRASTSVVAGDRLAQKGISRGWDGIHTRTARSSRTQWYGPSSTFYFIGRMNAYLSTVLKQPQEDHNMQPNSASRTFSSPSSLTQMPGELPAPPNAFAGLEESEEYLNSMEEDYFLDMFWHSYHPTYQILDEAEFREHYKSLWVESTTARASSALVDIVLALCMQYGVALAPGKGSANGHGHVDTKDASIAGRWYYRRSQTLLMSELESPSIATLQCHLFSVVYLCNASFQNMAHTTLALAVRTAHILGLHLEPPADMPRPQRELRKRIWWTLYTVETKTCMKLGRPSSVAEMPATCQLPADDHELARLSLSNIAAYGDRVTWFTYGRLLVTLVLLAQSVHSTFYEKSAEIVAFAGVKNLHADAHCVDASAEFLNLQMDGFNEWLRTVPDGMKTKRRDGGESFSVDRSGLELERYAPSWLQRQRLLLELLYHNLLMNTHRTFICFPSASATDSNGGAVAQCHAVSCLNHAMVITDILNQVQTTTDFLKGWYEAFQWQWNATLSMVGFVLAYPLHPSTPAARVTIDSAITVFEVFGNHFAVAASAADVTRSLVTKADFLTGRSPAGNGAMSMLTPPLPDAIDGMLGPVGINGIGGSSLVDEPPGIFQSTLTDAMGLAYNIDSFYSFEPLYAADAWTFNYQ